jgi:hypothetical protein
MQHWTNHHSEQMKEQFTFYPFSVLSLTHLYWELFCVLSTKVLIVKCAVWWLSVLAVIRLSFMHYRILIEMLCTQNKWAEIKYIFFLYTEH